MRTSLITGNLKFQGIPVVRYYIRDKGEKYTCFYIEEEAWTKGQNISKKNIIFPEN